MLYFAEIRSSDERPGVDADLIQPAQFNPSIDCFPGYIGQLGSMPNRYEVAWIHYPKYTLCILVFQAGRTDLPPNN